ncbi:MAG: hypothetical protein ACKO01_02360 [Erythrobacter sp.]
MNLTVRAAPPPAPRFHPRLWAAAAGLLLVPGIAMHFTPEVDWGAGDFALFAAMLSGLCLAVEAALRWLDTPMRRVAGVSLAVIVFLAIWAEFAVGIFD